MAKSQLGIQKRHQSPGLLTHFAYGAAATCARATTGASEQQHVADTAMQRHSRKKAPKHSQCAALAGRRCWMAEARVRAKCLRVVRIAPQQSDCQNGALLLRSADGVAGALYRALTEKVGEATSTEGCERRNRPPPPTPVSSSIRKPGARRVTLGGRAASGPRCLTCTPVVRPHTKEFCKEWTPAEKACYSRGLRCLNRGSPQTSRSSEVVRHPAVLEKPQDLTGFSRTCHNRGIR